MPTYQYACTSCGERLEAVQKFSDEPLTECPVCGGTLRKVFSPVGVVFKGSGFYKTDSRSSRASTSSSSKAADGAGTTSSTESTSTKSETAGETKPSTSEKKPGSGDKVA
jgi:putative FmdB family regulatory protein